MDFEKFPKMARISRNCIITEKIDGTNAQIAFNEDGDMFVGSRKRWITPEDDNYGFAAWCRDNKEELSKLGPGRHYGEWWGCGIQRKYGLDKKVFSLFNTGRWNDGNKPECCEVVPVLWHGVFNADVIEKCLSDLVENGSKAAPGFMNAEGIVIYHQAAGVGFKKTILKDEMPKGLT